MEKLYAFTKKQILSLVIILAAAVQGNAITYYSRTDGGLWSVNSTWSTVGYGNPVNTGTFPKKGDVVMIGDGYTIHMNVNLICASITVGEGSSGALEISDYLTWSMTIAGTLTVNNGAAFRYSGNKSRMHNIAISGSIINNGIIDLYSDGDDYANITFNSRINSIISGTGTFDLNRVSLVKSTSTAYYLDVQSEFFEQGVRQIVLTYGTYIHNNSTTYNVNSSLGEFTIAPDVVVQVPMGVINFSPAADNTYLQGVLEVNGGTAVIGSAAGNGGLRYDQNGLIIPEVRISSGTLEIHGGLRHESAASADPFRFNMTGGTLLLNTGITGSSEELFRMPDHASANVNITDGTIILEKPNGSGLTLTDFNIGGPSTTYNITGGMVQFGNSNTPASSLFSISPSDALQPHIRVSGPAGVPVTLGCAPGSTENLTFISLYIEADKAFDFRSVSGSSGDSRMLTLTDDMDGVHALFNEGTIIPRNSTLWMESFEGQWLGGTADLDLYNLTVNNPFGIVINANTNIQNTLLLLDGIVYTSSSPALTLTETGNANLGSVLSYVEGPLNKIVASASPETVNLPVGKDGIHRPLILAVQHSDATPVLYSSEMFNSSARLLGYTMPPSISHVSDIRYYTIDRAPVANLVNARVTISYDTDDLVSDYSNLRVARFDGMSAWSDAAGVATANGTGSITSGAFNSFNGYFTLGNNMGGSNPLPLIMTDFSLRGKEGDVHISWVTSYEKNCDYFTVEHSSDGLQFNRISLVNAVGNSNSPVSYSTVHNDAVYGINYYRLNEYDLDGTLAYSAVKSIYTGKKSALLVYPNPASANRINIQLPVGEISYEVMISDISGRLVYHSRVESFDNKIMTIDNLYLNSGLYNIILTGESGAGYTSQVSIQ